MARMLHRPVTKVNNQKVMLATPSYSNPCPGYSQALFASSVSLYKAGIDAELAIFSGDCHVDDARNRLVRDFLETDCTDLIFIDSDMRWNPEDLVNLCKYDRDVVGASYPLKQEDESFPITYCEDEILQADEDGLLKVRRLPTGFLRIKRHVLEKLASQSESFYPKSDRRSLIPIIFERTLIGKFRRGGDYTFCDKWTKIGGKIYTDPEIFLEHSGETQWKGSLGSFLRRKNDLSIKHCLKLISEGKETIETFIELRRAWDNPFSAAEDLLAACCQLARKADGNIIETGSGLSSLVMAAANPNITVYCIEDSDQWQFRISEVAKECGINNLHIHLSGFGTTDYGFYYQYLGDYPSKVYMILIDGPNRASGIDRMIALKVLSDKVDNAIIVADDSDDPKIFTRFNDWAKRENRETVEFGEFRRFIIAKRKEQNEN